MDGEENTPLLISVHEVGHPNQNHSSPPTALKVLQTSTMFWALGGIYGATAVALGAFGAHGLKKRVTDPQKLATWGTAAHYQLIHSGVLLLTASVAPRNKVAATLFTAGMTMFSGSIYLLVLDPARFKALGPVTPLGGVCLILGWFALALGPKGRVFIGAK